MTGLAMQPVATPKTLEDRMLELGIDPTGQFRNCAKCGNSTAVFCLLDVSTIDRIPGKVACSNCYMSYQLELQFVKEQNTVIPDTWESEIGQQLKASRNIALDKYAWTIRPDAGLSDVCVVAFVHYLLSWQRMAVDANAPSLFNPPAVPTLAYASIEETRDKIEKLLTVKLV